MLEGKQISIFWRHKKWPNFFFKSFSFSVWSQIHTLKDIFSITVNCSSCAKLGDSTSVSVASVMWMYEGDIDSASGENGKEPSSSISTETSFNGHSNKESLNVNKICWQQWKINGI